MEERFSITSFSVSLIVPHVSPNPSPLLPFATHPKHFMRGVQRRFLVFIRVLMGALKIPLINHHQSINIIIPPPLSLLNLGFQGRLGQIVCTRVIIAKETRKYFWNTTRKIRKTRCGLERRIYGIHVMLLCSSRPLLPPPNLCFGGFFRWGEEVRGIILFYQPTGPSSP